MQRSVEPEWLDTLAAGDPRAVRSRRDLEKVNASMGNAPIMARTLRQAFAKTPPHRMVEIGAGDGRFALSVARELRNDWREASFVLVDRVNAVQSTTRDAFAQVGWQAEIVTADVFDWLRDARSEPSDVIVANLFLHHFSKAQITGIFREAAKRARVFIAVEPRRSAWCLRFSQMLWVLGCNSVTRHDAPVSVRAGFAGRELSQLWPHDEDCVLEERAAGFFSHLFVARRGEKI